MKSGAVEFVEKPFNRQTLLDKVQRAIKDDADRLARESGLDEVRSRLEKLTDKEREVLRDDQGRTAEQGDRRRAWRSRPAPSSSDASSLMRKLGVRSLPELLRLTIVHESAREARRDSPLRATARPHS